MEFRSIIPTLRFPFSISYKDEIYFVGSCFTEHFTERMERLLFKTQKHPFGIVFNPLSIAEQLDFLLQGHPMREEQFFFHEGLWHSPLHHGSYSHPKLDVCQSRIQSELDTSKNDIKSANYIFITLGSAYYFEHKNSKQIYANCHKLPNIQFNKLRTSTKQIIESLESTITEIRKNNVQCKIIFTISPVRHLKDGFHENQLSKSSLLLASDAICHTFSDVYYFPAYELVLDDLRDYRFYNTDFVHPNSVAVEYIWQYFMESCFSQETKRLVAEVDNILKTLEHRPLHSDRDQYHEMLKTANERLEEIKVRIGR